MPKPEEQEGMPQHCPPAKRREDRNPKYHEGKNRLQEQDEHGQGKWEGKQKGKSDKRIMESKARQKETLHCAQT
jgi:hypothetical protein